MGGWVGVEDKELEQHVKTALKRTDDLTLEGSKLGFKDTVGTCTTNCTLTVVIEGVR